MNKKQRFVMGILLGSMWMSNIQSMEGGKEERKEIVPYAPAAPKEPIAAFGLPADLVKYIMKFLPDPKDLLALAEIIEQEALRTISKEGKPQLRLEAPGTMKEIATEAALKKEWLKKFNISGLETFEQVQKQAYELGTQFRDDPQTLLDTYKPVINAQDVDGNTALILVEKLRELLKRKAKTPAERSVADVVGRDMGWYIIPWLIDEAEADTTIKNKEGKSFTGSSFRTRLHYEYPTLRRF